jgi:pimeloyl-ACP methyl ester carboxylesterase
MQSSVTDAYVEVPGGEVFVRRWALDGGGGPPIVLLHDSLGSVAQFRDFPHALARQAGRDVIAYDRLGFGRSTARTERPSLRFIREEAEVFFPAIRDALGLTRYALFGHSVGGPMALAIAAADPDRCEAVVTEAAQAFVEPRTLEGIRAARAAFEAPAQFERLVRWHGDKAAWVLDAWAETWLAPGFASWCIDDIAAAVRCPVLAIHGEDDAYGSEAFPRHIAATVGGAAEVAILPGCGHVPHREAEREVLRLTVSFLDRR